MKRFLLIACVSLAALRAFGDTPAQPPPEQAVVIDLHRPWLDGANWDDNAPPIVYGVDATLEHPRFTVVDSNSLALWVDRVALPIELAKYPILTMKYRAHAASKNAPYVLRVVGGRGGAKSKFEVFKGSDLISDGQEHELKQDLRQLEMDGSVSTWGIALRTDTQPGWIELTELKFSAETLVEKLKDDSPLRIRVVDQNEKPIIKAIVSVDAERANFGRSDQTDSNGDVTITPLTNEQSKHMLRIERGGFMTMELPSSESESGQALMVKMIPAIEYGGTAEDSDGKVAAGAQVSIKLKPELLDQIPSRFQTNIVTSDTGEWKSLPLPKDASQVTVTLTQNNNGAARATDLDPAKSQVRLTREQYAQNLRQIGAAIMATAVAGPATAPAADAPADTTQLSPQQGIALDLNHPWIDATKWERNEAPNVYGIDMTRASPRINLMDANAKTMWALRLNVPIDPKSYPLLKFQYRASDTGSKTAYVLRVVHGERRAAKFFKADDLKTDGEVHELVADLREQKIDDKVVEIGIPLWTDQKPAWIDVVGLTFLAVPDAPIAQAPGDDPPIKFSVSTLDGTPLAGAKVIVDAERSNFVRSGETDDKGEVTVKPIANDLHTHMARIVKAGYLQIDHAIEGDSSEFKTVPAVRYGGVSRGESGQVNANAQVTVKAKSQFLKDTGLMPYLLAVVTTDEKGHWTTPPLPGDASLLTIQCKLVPEGGAEPVVSNLDVEQSQQPKEPWPAVAMAEPAQPKATPVATPAKTATAEHAPEPPKKEPAKKPVEPVTAIIQKVDDSLVTLGWTGIEGDQLLGVTHADASREEQVKIPLADVVDVQLKKVYSSATASFSLSAPATAPSKAVDGSQEPAPSTKPATILGNCRVVMADNDRVDAALLSWSDKRLSIRPLIATDTMLDLPVKSLREVWCGNAEQVKKAQVLKEQPGLDDIAFAVKDNDVVAVHGIVIRVDGEGLHFRFDGADRKISTNRLVGLIMAKSDEAPADDSLYEAVQLVNDNQLSGRLVALEPKTLVMRTRSGTELRLPIDSIAKISTRNGRLTYLSDLKPTHVEQIPYFDRMLDYQVDKSLNGKPITLSDGTYPRGVSMHSHTILTYSLDGKFSEFRAKAGFLLPEGKVGDCAIRVLCDGKALFEKPDARGDQPPMDLKIPVLGVRELKLEVDYGHNDDVGDRVAFANARLVRGEK